MAQQPFEDINRVYWDSFGPSYLEVFLDVSPPKSGVFLWHLKRKVAQFFVYVFYPAFIVVEIWGIMSRDVHTLMSMSFDISLFCHNVQNYLKMRFWLTNLPKVRSLCLDFSKFHVSAHRPFLTSWILRKESKSIRKYVGRCYLITYANLIFWFLIPTTQTLISYILYLTGVKEVQATYIPRYSPSRYPFDMSYLANRLLVFVLETPVFSLAFVYFQPIDMFLVTVINMAAAQFRALNAALFAMPADLEMFWSQKVSVEDTPLPMRLRLFIEDHQAMIRYGVSLRKFVSPILGLVTFNCVTIICNMTIVATAQLKNPGTSPVDYLFAAIASIGVVLTCLVVFYTYTSLFGVLKDAEESVFQALYFSNWYEKDVHYRKTVIFMQKLDKPAQRRIRMLGLGDMGRPTFVDGLRMIYSYYNFMQRFE